MFSPTPPYPPCPTSLSTSPSYPRPPPLIDLKHKWHEFLHLQYQRRKIWLRPFVRLPCIDLKSSSRCGHSRANSRREIKNQPEILVHQPNRKLWGIVALHHSLEFAHMRWSDHCCLGQHVQ